MVRKITFTKHPNTAEEFERVREEAIAEWQESGPAAIIAASWELTVLSYMLKGLDVTKMPMDRSKMVKKVVPWLDKRLDMSVADE